MAEKKRITGPEWRAIPKTDGYYFVSSKGEVVRSWRGWPVWPEELGDPPDDLPQRVSQFTAKSGHRRVGLRLVGSWKSHEYVHRLVVMAFLGPIPKGMHVNHKDGDPGNNDVQNLEIVTPAYNSAHGHVLRGIQRKGGRVPCVYQLPSGRWSARTRLPDGRRPNFTFETRAEAESAALKMLNERAEAYCRP